MKMDIIDRMDETGKAAWITAMVLGFVFFWPLGLAVLIFLLCSGRMGNWNCASGNTSWQRTWENNKDRMSGMHKDRSERRRHRNAGRRHRGSRHDYQPSGNTAFDNYREDTLRRLEDEQSEFETFLDRLRQAKDKEEFDLFMTEHKETPPPAPEDSAPQP
jgi:uncharacterized protein DUF2852